MILRPYRVTDHSKWFESYVTRGPAKNKYDRGPMEPRQCTKIHFRKMLKRQERMARKDKGYIYAAFHKRTGALIGAMDIFVIARDHYQMGNLGYQLDNRYWGQGYGKELARAGLQIGFSDLKLNRLEAAIDPGNKRSIALVRSIGLRREGIKKRYLYGERTWDDHVVYVANPEDIGLKARTF